MNLTAPELPFRSAPEGLVWPALAPSLGLTMLGLQYQFERSQWLSSHELGERQLAQLQSLLEHSLENVPYWQAVLPALGLTSGTPLTWEGWRRIPALRRRD